MRHDFHMCRALEGSLARPLPVANRLFAEACLRVVMGQELGLGLGNLGKLRRQHLGNALMVLLACTSE